jgi:hypothetical protein
MPITFDLRQEPGAGKPHAGICAGGGASSLFPPRRMPAQARLRGAKSAPGEKVLPRSVKANDGRPPRTHKKDLD